MYNLNRCRSKRQKLKPFTHAVSPYQMTSVGGIFGKVATEIAVVNGFFVSVNVSMRNFALSLLVKRTFLFSARAIRTADVASAGGDSAEC